VRGAKARGATVLALTRDAQSPLAKAVDGVFLVRGGGEARDDCAAAVCQLTAIHGLSVVMAQVLSRPSPRIEVLQGELRALPEHIAWVLRQLPDALRTLSGELSGLQEVSMLAGGFYYPAALMGANVLRGMGARRVRVFTPDEMDACFPESFERGEVVVVLSGSRCRVKKRLHGIIERLNRGQVKILAVTDQSEPEVARRAALAVLLPNLTENIGSIVGLALLLAAASQQASAGKGHARRSAGV
jgi:DNA-binding MurR/RpiR family transcriptional regulator